MTRRTPKPSNVVPLTTRHGVIQSTGELVDVEFPASRGRRRRSRRKEFAMIDLESLDRLELTGVQWRVLHRMMRAVAADTEARVHLTEIAHDLRMPASNVSRTMAQLRDRRVIRSPALGMHRINPHLMFRGSNQDWDLATDTHPEPIWRRS